MNIDATVVNEYRDKLFDISYIINQCNKFNTIVEYRYIHFFWTVSSLFTGKWCDVYDHRIALIMRYIHNLIFTQLIINAIHVI